MTLWVRSIQKFSEPTTFLSPVAEISIRTNNLFSGLLHLLGLLPLWSSLHKQEAQGRGGLAVSSGSCDPASIQVNMVLVVLQLLLER